VNASEGEKRGILRSLSCSLYSPVAGFLSHDEYTIRVITVEASMARTAASLPMTGQAAWLAAVDSELPCRRRARPGRGAAPGTTSGSTRVLRYGKVFARLGLLDAGLSDDQVFDSDRMLPDKERDIERREAGNCVLVGAGGCALAGQPGCFHVFVYATATAKREWFMQAFPARRNMQTSFWRRLISGGGGHPQGVSAEWCSGAYHMLLNSAMDRGDARGVQGRAAV